MMPSLAYLSTPVPVSGFRGANLAPHQSIRRKIAPTVQSVVSFPERSDA